MITEETDVKSTKKEYKSPELKDFGKVGEITQTKGSGGIDDGSGTPAYSS